MNGRTDGWTDGHLRQPLLGRLGGVDLKIVNVQQKIQNTTEKTHFITDLHLFIRHLL